MLQKLCSAALSLLVLTTAWPTLPVIMVWGAVSVPLLALVAYLHQRWVDGLW